MISQSGIDLVKRFEGLRLKAYKCPAGVWTIGYGHTGVIYESMVITEEQAEKFLRNDLAMAESAVLKYAKTVTQCQKDALASFVFNLGSGNFAKSTLLKKLRAGDIQGAADEFLKWNKAGGKELEGLTKRRAAERALFLGGT